MATAKDFRAFVERQKAEVSKSEVDWSRRRDIWLIRIDELYSTVRAYLSEYTAEGAVRLELEDIEINEENIGPYKARRMIIEIGNNVVTLTPIGTKIFGAIGRVDLDGPAGKVRLVLVDVSLSAMQHKIRVFEPGKKAQEEASGERTITWKISTAPPRVQLADFSKENFYDAILEVTNG